MKKLTISLGALVFFVLAPVAFAQTYSTCVSIPAGLSQGSNNSSVLALQQFLVVQNYPGSGSWMETGYFGAATAAAVRDFQAAHNLPQTGSVDASTAATISTATCGGYQQYPSSLYPSTSIYPAYPSTATYPGYPGYSYSPYMYNNYYSNYYGGAPVITTLSQNTGSPGQSVTVYGTGFDPYNNTVTIGGVTLANVPSSGTSLTFTIPYTNYPYSFAGTQTQLSISTSHGSSNSVAFTIYSYNSYGCGVYPYTSSCGGCNGYSYGYSTYGYNYNSSCPPLGNTTQPTIQYLTPTSGSVGTSVTVYGSGFTTSGNTVHFGAGIIANLLSSDGRSISFIVPSTLTGYGTSPVTLSTYQVSVTNGSGYTSNTLPFTVTGTAGSNGAPTITSVTGPTSLQTGVSGTWTVNVSSGFNQYLTFNVSWGDQNVYPYASQAAQSLYQTNTLTHTYYQSGTYTLTFTVSNGAGQSNTYTTTVVITGSSYGGAPNLSYLSPNAAYVGQTVTIYGSGFAGTNTILFGQGALQNTYSSNGTSLTFTVPSSVGPYCPGYTCPLYVQQITPGTYNVSVMSQSGTSNTLTFTVL